MQRKPTFGIQKTPIQEITIFSLRKDKGIYREKAAGYLLVKLSSVHIDNSDCIIMNSSMTTHTVVIKGKIKFASALLLIYQRILKLWLIPF